MKLSILVTGASGFIGAEVCNQLVTSRYRVIAVVSPFTKSTRLNNLSKKLEIVKVNLANEQKVFKLISKYKPYAILHLATHGVYTYQQQDEDRIVIDNLLMTFNLLKYSQKFGIKKFINTGSVFEYGSKKGKMKENDVNLDDVLNKYSAIKMATTALANSFAEKISVITLRPFTTYGPDEDDSRFIKATIKRALNDEPIRLVKGVVRDFVYVEDVANAYVKALSTKFKSGEIINIASGRKSGLDNVAILIKKLTKSNSKILIDEMYKRSKESACFADISKSKKVLGWKPEITLLQGLQKVIYCLQNGI